MCSVEGCEKPKQSRGWCNMHYLRWYKHQDLSAGKKSGRRPMTPEERRAHTLRRMQMTVEQYDQMFTVQGGGCAACGAPPGNRALSVDHDHACCPRPPGGGKRTCGKCTRGLLCHNCNVALGHLKDDVTRLEALITYLNKWNTEENN